MPKSNELNILLVEDEEADALLTMHALRAEGAKHDILWVTDGEQALQALSREGPYGSAPRPNIILLDLNLPKTDGHEILRKIKTNSSFKSIPVFMLTHSNSSDDIESSFLSWADTYIVKPMKRSEFDAAVEQLSSTKKTSEFESS